MVPPVSPGAKWSVLADQGTSVEQADGPEDVVAFPSSVRELFHGIQMKQREDGSMVIEAPPRAASMLVDVLEGMAKMLRAAQ